MIIKLKKDNIDKFTTEILKPTVMKEECEINPFATYLGYIEDNKIIGYIYYSDIYDRAEINQIEIEISHRNCGKGFKLLNKMIELVDKSISLEVREDNIPAIKLYEKCGFRAQAIRKNYYQEKDGILMVREKQGQNGKIS